MYETWSPHTHNVVLFSVTTVNQQCPLFQMQVLSTLNRSSVCTCLCGPLFKSRHVMAAMIKFSYSQSQHFHYYLMLVWRISSLMFSSSTQILLLSTLKAHESGTEPRCFANVDILDKSCNLNYIVFVKQKKYYFCHTYHQKWNKLKLLDNLVLSTELIMWRDLNAKAAGGSL